MPEQVVSTALEKTIVTAHLEAEIGKGKNIVFCASFQMAWDQLTNDWLRTPLELEGNPKTAQILNQHLIGKDDILDVCYVAMVGTVRDHILDKIHQALAEKFGETSQLDLILSNPNGVLAYAFLQKSLPFDAEFEVFDERLQFSDGVAVKTFGLKKNPKPVDQVEILSYMGPDDFIIRLRGSTRVDEDLDYGMIVNYPRITDDIILAKVEPRPTLRQTIDAVFARTTTDAQRQARWELSQQGFSRTWRSPQINLDAHEILEIPKIDISLPHHYEELMGKRWHNPGFEAYFIEQAVQTIKFRLDEKGAKLRSEAGIVGTIGIGDNPRTFIFDKPFLICLREKEATYPYLAVWIENSELLVK